MQPTRRCLTRATLGASLAVTAACGHDGAPPPRTLYTLSPAEPGASAASGTVVREGLAVVVRDPSGAAASGVTVRFRLAAGDASSLRDSIAVSGPDGVARGEAIVRAAGGVASFSAAVRGQDDSEIGLTVGVTAAPALRAVEPATFAGGDTITLRGSALGALGRGPSAFFNNVIGNVVSVLGDTAARVVAPACLAAGATSVRLASALGSTSAVAGTAGAPAPVSLGVGGGAVEPGVATCLTLAGAGDYVVVPQFAGGESQTSSAGFSLGVSGGAATALETGAAQPLSTRARLDRMLRARERETAPLARAAARGGVALAALGVGDSRTFHVITNLCVAQAGGCGLDFGTVRATLRYLGDHVALYVDDEKTPGAQFGDAELQSFGALFDRTLYQVDARTFGTESDVDGNGHVIVLMSPAVNGLTAAGDCAVGGYVAGFFFSDDLTSSAATSNRGEVFYTIAPDATGAKSCAHSADAVKRVVPSTFVHELQHMISFNQHVLVRGGAAEEDWLNEGLSHAAEEMAARYYEGLIPALPPSAAAGARANAASMFPDSAAPFIDPNIGNAYNYLRDPSSSSMTDDALVGSLEQRGAAWLFLRWLADQKGDGILTRLVQTTRTGTANVADKAREPFASLFNDFALATYGDSLPGVARALIAPRYHFAPNRNLRSMFARVSPTYPVAPRALAAGATARRTMHEGTMAFYALSSTAAAPYTFTLQPSAGTAFTEALAAQVGVLRVR